MRSTHDGGSVDDMAGKVVAAFLDAGAKVVIGDGDATLAREAASVRGDRATGLALNVTDPASFDEYLTPTVEPTGSLDVLVNNAGIMPTGFLLPGCLPGSLSVAD